MPSSSHRDYPDGCRPWCLGRREPVQPGGPACADPNCDAHREHGADPGEDFYEDDEPVADVVAAFEGGEKFVTRPPGGAAPVPVCATHRRHLPCVFAGEDCEPGEIMSVLVVPEKPPAAFFDARDLAAIGMHEDGED